MTEGRLEIPAAAVLDAARFLFPGTDVKDVADYPSVAGALEVAYPHLLAALEERLLSDPDISVGDVITAEPDGTITLDDGITTWNPARAVAFLIAKEKRRAETAEKQLVALQGDLERRVEKWEGVHGSVALELRTAYGELLNLLAATPSKGSPDVPAESEEGQR